MMSEPSYIVIARRLEGWWALDVTGPGLSRTRHTQAKRLTPINEMVTDLLSLALDVEPDEVPAFTVSLHLTEELDEELRRIATLRAQAAQLSEAMRQAAVHL